MLTLATLNNNQSIAQRLNMVRRSTQQIVNHLNRLYRHTTLTCDTYNHLTGEQVVIYHHETAARLVFARITARLDGTYSASVRVEVYDPRAHGYVPTLTRRAEALDTLQDALAWLDTQLASLGLRKRIA